MQHNLVLMHRGCKVILMLRFFTVMLFLHISYYTKPTLWSPWQLPFVLTAGMDLEDVTLSFNHANG